jgi:Zn-dependent protease
MRAHFHFFCMIQLLTTGNYALFILLLVALIVSLTFHEYGHAIMAKWQGDNTAERLGRLTLSPLAHIDPVGMLMVVFIGIGYAKPVPIDPRNFKSSMSDFWVAGAGPFMNLLLAVLAWTTYQILLMNGLNNEAIGSFFFQLASINLVLMLFNLIPLGPLDGHYILPYFLPRDLSRKYRDINERMGSMALIGLIVLSMVGGVPIFSFLFDAAFWMLGLMTFI